MSILTPEQLSCVHSWDLGYRCERCGVSRASLVDYEDQFPQLQKLSTAELVMILSNYNRVSEPIRREDEDFIEAVKYQLKLRKEPV